MAKHGMKLMDSDMHIIEPPDVWERYIDPAFKARAPKGWPGHENPSVLEVDGRVYPKSARTPAAHYQTMYDKVSGRYTHAIARGYDAVSQLEGMDVEGIDVAVLFPTRGLYALAKDDLDPALEGVLKIMPDSMPTAAASAESSRASAGFHLSGACAHSLCSSDAAAPASPACAPQSSTTVSRQIPARETSA